MHGEIVAIRKVRGKLEFDFSSWDWAEEDDSVLPNLVPSLDRLNNVEWATLQALRDMLGIALKGTASPTYAQSLMVGKDIAPAIFDSDESILGNDQERLLVKEFRQRAQAKSITEGRDVSPIDLIKGEIESLSDLLNKAEDDSLIQRRIAMLSNARKDLEPKAYSENQLILRDTFKVKRDLPGPVLEGDSYRDFQLAKGRGLRLRLLHPDPPEHSLGADLLYEQYWDAKKMARIVLVQYKIWDGRILYLSQAQNLEAQLGKLDESICQQSLCAVSPTTKRSNSYRLPYCSAFLKPTDKLQDKDATLISNGLYVPVCVVRRQLENTVQGNKKLERKRIRSEALSHKFFEEAFNINMLGSKWLTYEEIEELYKRYKLFDENDRIRLHAQEFNLVS